MDITWIIGNGFDLNLGLKTAYSDFLDNVYLQDSNKSKLKDVLLERLEDNNSKTVVSKKHWSDLEALLGKATSLYSPEEIARYTDTFEEMEQLLAAYVQAQESRLPETLPEASVNEFRDSIIKFDGRMAPLDSKQFSITSYSGNITHNFISLNYTHALKRFIDAACGQNRIMSQRRNGFGCYNDIAIEPFYPHGELLADGAANSIVFGVNSAEQISNKDFAEDSDFLESWVKQNRNSSLYGNTNEERLAKLIGNADVICIYGCSMGESDLRIWHLVGEHLTSSANSKLIMFVHELPNRRGPEHSKYQQVRGMQKAIFQNVAGLSADEMGALNERIFFVPSQDFFKMEGKLELA